MACRKLADSSQPASLPPRAAAAGATLGSSLPGTLELAAPLMAPPPAPRHARCRCPRSGSQWNPAPQILQPLRRPRRPAARCAARCPSGTAVAAASGRCCRSWQWRRAGGRQGPPAPSSSSRGSRPGRPASGGLKSGAARQRYCASRLLCPCAADPSLPVLSNQSTTGKAEKTPLPLPLSASLARPPPARAPAHPHVAQLHGRESPQHLQLSLLGAASHGSQRRGRHLAVLAASRVLQEGMGSQSLG